MTKPATPKPDWEKIGLMIAPRYNEEDISIIKDFCSNPEALKEAGLCSKQTMIEILLRCISSYCNIHPMSVREDAKIWIGENMEYEFKKDATIAAQEKTIKDLNDMYTSILKDRNEWKEDTK